MTQGFLGSYRCSKRHKKKGEEMCKRVSFISSPYSKSRVSPAFEIWEARWSDDTPSERTRRRVLTLRRSGARSPRAYSANTLHECGRFYP